MHGTAVKII